MTETRRLTTIEHQLESALAAVRTVQARGLRVIVAKAGYGELARVQIMDPGHVIDDLGRHGMRHSLATTDGGRPIVERYTVIGDACVFWLIAADAQQVAA